MGDDQFDIDETLRLATSVDVQIEQVQGVRWAVEMFDRTNPDILILCHSHVDLAFHFYLSLMMFSKKGLETPHQVILMCDGKQAQSAYDVCARHVFDDYVVYKPLFDVQRLKYSAVSSNNRNFIMQRVSLLAAR